MATPRTWTQHLNGQVSQWQPRRSKSRAACNATLIQPECITERQLTVCMYWPTCSPQAFSLTIWMRQPCQLSCSCAVGWTGYRRWRCSLPAPASACQRAASPPHSHHSLRPAIPLFREGPSQSTSACSGCAHPLYQPAWHHMGRGGSPTGDYLQDSIAGRQRSHSGTSTDKGCRGSRCSSQLPSLAWQELHIVDLQATKLAEGVHQSNTLSLHSSRHPLPLQHDNS